MSIFGKVNAMRRLSQASFVPLSVLGLGLVHEVTFHQMQNLCDQE